jgi:flagellar hook-basal body complex protein FliE
MTIAAIGPISGITPPIGALTQTDGTTNQAGGAGGFGNMLMHGINNLQQVQSNADDLAVSAATGDLTDVHDYMIASTEAQLATQLTVAVRNKAVEAFNEIMRMQA